MTPRWPFHTPETKQASKQWLPRGSRPPKKFRVQGSHKMQMVITWFDNMGLIYQHHVPVGTKVKAPYFSTVMTTFLKNSRFKRPANAKKEWFLHMDNCSCHTAKVTKEFITARSIKLLTILLTHQTWCRRTSSSSPRPKTAWLALPSVAAQSRSGRGSAAPSPRMTMWLRSTSGWTAGRGASREREIMWKNNV